MTKEEIDDLFENNMPLYKEKVRSGEIPHNHHWHWDNASSTFMTEIESCCECDSVKFPRLNEAEQAIQRVRELHKPFSKLAIIICDSCVCIYPCPTIEALDGEQ